MNIEVIRKKNGTAYKATVGSRGQRIRKTFTRKLDAERWIASMHSGGEDEQDKPGRPSELRQIAIEELYRLFKTGYAEIHQQPGTRIREQKIVSMHLKKHFGARDVNSITRQHVQQYLYGESRLGKRKAATINKHFQVIHKLFAWAAKNGLMATNPAAGVERLPEKDTVYSPDFKFLEGEDLSRALEKFRELYPDEFPVLLTAVATGMRVGEVCALQRRDLLDTVANPVLIVRRTFCTKTKQVKETTKGGSSRIVPASDQLLAVLKPLLPGRMPNQFLFFDTYEQALTTRNILYKKWTRAQKLCGIEPRTVHALRHTYATQFLSHGGSTFALQRILGHSSAKITDKYSHFSKAMVEASRNVVQIPLKKRD